MGVLMAFIFAASLPNDSVGQQISEICVLNHAGFAAIFDLVNYNKSDATTSGEPGMYPAPEGRCLRGTAMTPAVSDGDQLTCRVHAVAGTTNTCQGPSLVYNASAALRANFECTGTTLSFSCAFTGTEATEPALVKNVVEICVRNHAGFDAIFQLVNHNNSNATTVSPDMYPAPRTECLEGTAMNPGASDGDVLGCRVNAVAGTTNDCQGPLVVYNGSSTLRANYDCTGTTFDFTCLFAGTEEIVGRCTDQDKDTWGKVFAQWPQDFKDCGLKCVGAAPCVNNCMIEKEGWSSPCASCMGDLVDCSKATGCLQDQACIQRNCMQAYFDCTGLFTGLTIEEEKVDDSTVVV